MLLTIRSGGMRLVSRDGTVSEPLTGTPTLANPPRLGGMQDVILDRDFAKNRTLYFSYAIRVENSTDMVGRIVSARLSKRRESHQRRQVAARRQRCSRVALSRRATERCSLSRRRLPPAAPNPQSLQSLLGKVLRINT